MEPSSQQLAPAEDDAERVTLADDLRQLADEAKALAQAEFAFQKSRAAYAGAETRTISLLLLVGAVLVFFAVMALVTGSVIALGPLLGPWGATAAVTFALLMVAGICAVSARTRLARMKSVLADPRDNP